MPAIFMKNDDICIVMCYNNRQSIRRRQRMIRYTRKAQYHETDQMGVIYHANYFK